MILIWSISELYFHLRHYYLKRGRTFTKDEHRSRRPVEVTTPEMIDKIYGMVFSDRRIKVREIVKATGITESTVFSILHEKLDVKKISARWVPRLLSKENKRNSVFDSEAVFGAFPSQSWRVFASLHNCGRNMDTSLHSRDKVGFWRRTGSEDGKDGEIVRQGDGHGFFWMHAESSTPIIRKKNKR